MRKALFYVFSICAKEKKKFLLKLDFVLLIDPEVEQKNSGFGPIVRVNHPDSFQNCPDSFQNCPGDSSG